MDFVVLWVKSDKIKVVVDFGNLDKVKFGELVIVIGNLLGFEFVGFVIQGVILGMERVIFVDLNDDGQFDWNVEVL